MKVTYISDLHGFINFKIEPCDLLLIGGDICPLGTESNPFIQANFINMSFSEWLKDQPAKHKLLIWGNHDVVGQKYPLLINSFVNDRILDIKQVRDIEGIKIWGSHYSLPFGRTLIFMEEEDKLDKIYSLIPNNTDIIVSHGPPYKMLDKTVRGENVGSKSLSNHINRVNPKLVCVGHIHEDYGTMKVNYDNTTIINGSLLDHHKTIHKLSNKPITVEL